MRPAPRQLTDLLANCMVWVRAVDDAAPTNGGSGVWITPSTVLTCAHVVAVGTGEKVRLDWQGRHLAGFVTEILPATSEETLWPYPDLALVRVSDTCDHPCAWLSEESLVIGTSVVVVGHSTTLDGTPRYIEIGGQLSGRSSFHSGMLWQFKKNEVVAGMSGGPVLNLQSGAVCGITTTTLGEGADRGGFLVPLEGLRKLPVQKWRGLMREHDRYHRHDQRWTALRSELPAKPEQKFVQSPVTAQEEIELLGLLARFPVQEDLASLYATASPYVHLGRSPFTDLRDIAYELMDYGVGNSGSLSPVLRLTERLSNEAPDSEIGVELRDWTTSVAARINESEALRRWRKTTQKTAKPSDSSAVIVQIEASALDAHRFHVTVWVHRGEDDVVRLYCDDAAVHTLEAAKAVACQQIRDALRWLDGDACVEFVTSVDLFDEPFDELVPTKSYTNLGRKYEVVLRDLHRVRDATSLREPTTMRDWRRRWRKLHDQYTYTLRWIGCDDIPSPEVFSAELEQQPELSAVALTRRPNHSPVRDAVEVALDSGVPAILWRRGACTEHDRGSSTSICSGIRFQNAFASERDSFPDVPLPALVRMIRNRVVGDPCHACNGIVLLWDNPERLPEPAAPLSISNNVQATEDGVT